MRQSIPELQRHDNGYYYIHWTDKGPPGKPGRSRRASTGKADLAAAQKVFANWLAIDAAVPIDQKPALTTAELWAIYDRKHVQPNVTAGDRLDRAWLNLEPHFGGLTVPEITRNIEQYADDSEPDIIARYLKKRTAGAIGRPSTPSTVRRELGALLAMINWCAEPKRKLVEKTDVPDIELPPHGEPVSRWLTTDEIQRLHVGMAELRRVDRARMSRGERFVWIALESAKRKTAICELTWSRVDFETLVMDFDVPGRKKTRKRRGAVPISKSLLPVLKRMYDERDPGDEYVVGPGEDVLMSVKRGAALAKLKGVTAHVLRHTAATHMARRGVPLWLVAKVLGNSLAMVERVYAKHSPDDLRQAVDAITGGTMSMGK